MADSWAQMPAAVQCAARHSVDRRWALFDDAAHELVHQMGMRAVVATALLEGQVALPSL